MVGRPPSTSGTAIRSYLNGRDAGQLDRLHDLEQRAGSYVSPQMTLLPGDVIVEPINPCESAGAWMRATAWRSRLRIGS